MKLRIFELAKRTAMHSQHPDHRHGAILVRKNKIISVGFNTTKTHPKAQSYSNSIHAEFSAILNSNIQDFTGYELYVVRVRSSGQFGNSKPCKYCQKMLKSLGINKIHYSTDTYFESEKL